MKDLIEIGLITAIKRSDKMMWGKGETGINTREEKKKKQER